MRKILKLCGGLLLLLAALVVCLCAMWKKEAARPLVTVQDLETIQPGGEIEAHYTGFGDAAVQSVTYDISGERWTQLTVWYPAEMETAQKSYPLIVMANGTGVQAFRYAPVFAHLSSWGFIVVGNDDSSSGLGDSTAKTLDFMLAQNQEPDSPFFQKIDMEKIGVAGHSQGGVGAIHALSAFPNAQQYQAAYLASATTESMIEAWNLTDFVYDISKITTPIFMTAGTGPVDSGTISPLADMQRNFARIPGTAILARRKNADHGEMLYVPNGYMVAWFRYMLLGDAYAARAFVGADAELLQQENWQDVQRKGLPAD